VTDLRGVIGVINLSDWSRNWRKTRTGRSPIWSTRSIFRTFTPTIRWIWRWSAWANEIEILPVVNRANVHKLEGIVTLRDVLDAYGVKRS